MKIIGFLDEGGRTRFGSPTDDARLAQVLEGDPFGNLRSAGEAVRIVRLLAPVEPVNIFCIGLNYRPHAQETGAASGCAARASTASALSGRSWSPPTRCPIPRR